ncbi:hypothetical protein WJX84_006950 [Apatococcus fuscideae]|uniref:Thiol methyltransferase 1 n=1 Tax=Apatococcus fuscideae TaxID=2026836 RepID=A0AAW1S6J6_9CHLO
MHLSAGFSVRQSVGRAPGWSLLTSHLTGFRACAAVPNILHTKQALSSMAGRVSKEDYRTYWETTWKGDLKPGEKFDAGKAAPVLKALLDDAGPECEGKTALVPGCGRGYDVIEFAQHGCMATGLEISPSATEAANRYADDSGLGAERSKATFVTGDFFHHPHQYDYGYDYTFMCSFVPDKRSDWADTWGRLIKPGGELITLIFPVGLGVPEPPPFDVTPEQYEKLLIPHGFHKILIEKLPDNMSHKPRAGKEWIGRWRKTSASL